jgi:hypothetical protein
MTATQTAQALTDLNTRTPVEIDTVLAALDAEYGALANRLAHAMHTAHIAAGDTAITGAQGENAWQMSDDQAICALDITHAAYANVNIFQMALAMNQAQFKRLDAEYYRRGGWTRFVQVEHIHSGWDCVGGTLDRGQYRSDRHWRPEMSGRDQGQAIAELQRNAHVLCTRCFPGAPVLAPKIDPDVCTGSGTAFSPVGRHSVATMSKFATCPVCKQHETITAGYSYRTHLTVAAKARKLAEKAAAAGKLVVAGEIKTVRATELAASDPDRSETEREAAIAALAGHRGETVEAVRAAADTKRRQRAAR